MKQRYFVAKAREFENYKGLAEIEGEWLIQEFSQNGYNRKLQELESNISEGYNYGRFIQRYQNFTMLFYIVPAYEKVFSLDDLKQTLENFYNRYSRFSGTKII